MKAKQFKKRLKLSRFVPTQKITVNQQFLNYFTKISKIKLKIKKNFFLF